mmetsp:Transcript_2999/g.10814  ORF Transcript_2999/g.10814 Transcript_2999/m.10814 type:complete len:223 (+) Transcript_2999:54-722(+)
MPAVCLACQLRTHGLPSENLHLSCRGLQAKATFATVPRARAACGLHSNIKIAAHAQPGQPSQDKNCGNGVSRRASLEVALASLSLLGVPSPAYALFGLGSEQPEGSVPKKYGELAQTLIDQLREPLNLEAGGAEMREVRKKAAPAGETIKTFIREWGGSSKVSGVDSYKCISDALGELTSFYTKNGSMTRLDGDVRERILASLNNAEAALTEELKPLESSLK